MHYAGGSTISRREVKPPQHPRQIQPRLLFAVILALSEQWRRLSCYRARTARAPHSQLKISYLLFSYKGDHHCNHSIIQ